MDPEEQKKVPVAPVVFVCVAAFLFLCSFLLRFARSTLSLGNVLCFITAISGCVLLLLGLFRGKPMLFAFGLFTLAIYGVIEFVEAYFMKDSPLNGILPGFLVGTFILAGLYYLIQTILPLCIHEACKLAVSVIMICLVGGAILYVVGLSLIAMDRMSKDVAFMAITVLPYLCGRTAFILIWIAIILYSPFPRN